MTLLTLAGIAVAFTIALGLCFLGWWPAAVFVLAVCVGLVYRLARSQRLERAALTGLGALVVLGAGLVAAWAAGAEPLYLHAAGLAVAPDRIFISDLSGQRILVLNPDFTLQAEWLRGNGNPAGLAVDGDGRLIVAYPENQFYIRVRDGAPQDYPTPGGFGEALGQFRLPVDVATDNEKRLYIVDADNDRVVVFHPDGRTYQTQLPNPPQPMHNPRGVAVSPLDQTVYVADTYNNRVLVYAPVSGGFQFKAVWPLRNSDALDDLLGPEDVTVRANGEVIVADAGNKRLVVFNPDGQFLSAVDPCAPAGCRPGQLTLSADGNAVLFVDSIRNAVRVRTLQGAVIRDYGAQPGLPPNGLTQWLTALPNVVGSGLVVALTALLALALMAVTTARWFNFTAREAVARGMSGILALLWPGRRTFGVQRLLDGKLQGDGPLRLPGPTLVTVDGASAVVFERNGQVSRVSGPGRVFTEPGEVIRALFDLRVQTRLVDQTQEAVYSREGIPLEVKFTLQYRIIQDEATLVTKGRYLVQDEVLRRVALNAMDWHAQTEQAAKSVLREMMSARHLEQIFDPHATVVGHMSPRAPLQQEMRRRLTQTAARWGVEIIGVTLDEIRLPQAVRDRLLQVWDIEWHRLVEVGREQTEVWKLAAQAEFKRDEERRQLESRLQQAQLRLQDMRNTALAGWEVEQVQLAREKELLPARAELESELNRLKTLAAVELGRLQLNADLESERVRLGHDQSIQPERAKLNSMLKEAIARAEMFLDNLQRDHAAAAQLEEARTRANVDDELERLRLESRLALRLKEADLKQLDRDEVRALAGLQAELDDLRATAEARVRVKLGAADARVNMTHLQQLIKAVQENRELLRDPKVAGLVAQFMSYVSPSDLKALQQVIAQTQAEDLDTRKPTDDEARYKDLPPSLTLGDDQAADQKPFE
jgi:DNA-binding beta-propeller fold protein YncE